MSEENKVEETAAPVEQPVEKQWFIGTKLATKILTDGNDVFYTPDGEDVPRKASQEQFASMVSELPYDDAEVQLRRWKPVVAKMLGVLLEADMQLGDKDFVLNRLEESLIKNYNDAVAKLFKRKHISFIRLGQIDEILKQDSEMVED